MAYGTYDRRLNDTSGGDAAIAALTPAALTAVLGSTVLTKRVVEPITVDRFGYHPSVAFIYGSGPVTGVLGLYRYPHGLVCFDLPTALAMCNALTTAMNAHAADAVIHKIADVASGFPLPTTPVVDLPGMMVQVNLMQIAYAAHNVDAIISPTPTIHVATTTTQALAGSSAVTTLVLTIAKLNDILTKYNLHQLYVTGHYFGNYHPAYKVLLGTLNLVDLSPIGWNYFSDIDNQPQVAVPPYQGVGYKGVADFAPGDVVAIEIKTLAVGGTGTGNFVPYFCDHTRAEETQNCPMMVDLTPVKAAVPNNVLGD